MLFESGNKIFEIKRDESEIYEYYIERCKFIVAQEPITENDLKETIRLSRVYINIEKKECKYSNEMMEKIEKMKEKI